MNLSHSPDGLRWLPTPTDWPAAVRGGVSTRLGGASTGALRSLNVGTRVGDRPENIATNLARLARAVGTDLTSAARIELAHGADVLRADRGGLLGTADAVYTTHPKRPLALTVADCLPLLLCAGDQSIALAHCGWRGSVARLAAATVAALRAVPGAETAGLRAWIGPGIGPCCFRITEELKASFPDAVIRTHAGDGALYADLPELLRRDLVEAGVAPAAITLSGICTACRPEFFYSHRRDVGKTGRMLAWIVLDDQS